MYVTNRTLYSTLAVLSIVLLFLILNHITLPHFILSIAADKVVLLRWQLACSMVALVLFGTDKILSKMSKKRRVPEFTLMLVSAVGGVTGSFAGMILFMHKTRKLKFWLLNVAVMLAFNYRYFMPYP